MSDAVLVNAIRGFPKRQFPLDDLLHRIRLVSRLLYKFPTTSVSTRSGVPLKPLGLPPQQLL
jgi:hypothetical protein